MTRFNAPRWLKLSTVAAVSLIGIFYLVGGLVFANMIHADALTPQAPAHDNGVYVIDVAADEITLTSEEAREDTVRPGLAGLFWEGGYGLLGEIRSIEGLRVTRDFEVVTGSVPEPCVGQLDVCEPVDIEGHTYESDPSDVDLDFSEVTISASIGNLGAWRVDSGDNAKWVIHVHGWRAERREAIRSLRTYHEAGFSSLVIDYRNDVNAPSDPAGIYRFGKTEWEDVEAAVKYAVDQGAGVVILHGYSTGAAINLSFLEKSSLADEVRAAVSDSPNIDMAETVKYAASKRLIPGTPIPVPGSLTAVAMFIADQRWDIGWGDIDYAERADEIVTIPMLVFHGEEDDRVPIDVSRAFRDRAPELIELHEVEFAGHVTSWNVDPEFYDSTLTGFLERSGG